MMDADNKADDAKSAQKAAKEPETFGVVAITEKTPATPDRFSFWARDDESVPLEPGRLVTAKHPQNASSQAIGIVDSLYATRDIGTPLDSYYSHGYGNPDQQLATHQDLVRVAGVEVIRRTDGKNQPVSGSWPVRFSTAPEIIAAYGADVKPDKAMLGGFALDAYGAPVPIHLDSRFVLGYESAHINISGASGLATKTSYALFLIYSALAYSKTKNQRVAAVAFNVKESDLLRIANLPGKGKGDKADWAECLKLFDKKFGAAAEHQKNLWRASLEQKVDPYALVKGNKVRFFVPSSKDDANKPSVSAPPGANLETFYHVLQDFSRSGDSTSLEVMFEAEDLDDKLTTVLYSTVDWLHSEAGKGMTFSACFSELWRKVKEKKGKEIPLGNTSVHSDTLIRFVRRLEHAVRHQLKGLVSEKDSTGKPIPVENLKPDELWVIDISRLHDKGQRMVFFSVIDRIYRLLEAKRNRETKALLYEGAETDISEFPEKVVVFVDELNKFAPARVLRAPLRSRIVEITARGRSYGLSLIGAEQLASQIDEQVLTNTSTFAVGRTHSLEIGGRTYEWLREGLKQRAQTLQKGEMFLWHAVHARPALIHFPVPLHQLLDE